MASIGMRGDRVPWIVFATLLYIVTAGAYFVLPVADSFDHVLLGSTPFAHDSVLNAGILEWGFRALWDSQLSLFDWTAGFPLKNTLAGTEHLVGWQVFYSPLRALGLTVAAAYNVVILLSFVISGVGTALLARRLGASRSGAALGGFVFAFNPFHVDHAIHVQTMAVCWSPFALLGLEMTLARDGRFKGPVLMAAAFVMTALSGMYFGVFLPLVLAMYAIISWLMGRHRFDWRVARDIALAAVVSLAALTPVLIPYVRYAATWGAYPQTAAVLTKFSLPLVGLVKTPNWLAVWQHTRLASEAISVGAFPGIIALVLAGFGLFAKGESSSERQISRLLITLAIATFLFALGPVLTLRTGIGFEPLAWLPLPGRLWLSFTAIRWPMRIFMYSIICGAILVALGVSRVRTAFPRRGAAVVSVLAVLLWFELRPATWYASKSLYVYDPVNTSDAYPFLASEKDRGGVVELPSRTESGYATPYATRYAYASAGHLRRVVSFHGSLLPPLLDSLRKASFHLPDSASKQLFVTHGVTRLVIHKNILPPDSGNALVRVFEAKGYPMLFNSELSAVFAIQKDLGGTH